MLHTYQPTPFADAVRQGQFEALVAALIAESQAPDTLLLGNFPLESGPETVVLEAVVVRPRSITLLLLVPTGGLLNIPDFRVGPWLLNEAPLLGTGGTENPFQQFQAQREALAAWLAQLLPTEAANLNFISGLVLFAEPVRFGPEVEERMSSVPAASAFHLLPDPARFTRRLSQLASPEIDLSPTDLHLLMGQLGLELPPTPTASPAAAYQPGPADLLRQQAGKLWRWLGAEELSELDRTDSGYEIDLVAIRNQEKAQLEELRANLQATVSAQLQALEKREAEREQSLAKLREELAAASPAAPEAAALASRLAAENEEKVSSEATMQAYQAQSAARTQELEQKIQQLEALIRQLSPDMAGKAAAVPTSAPAAPAASGVAAPAARPTWPRTLQLQFRQPKAAAQAVRAALPRWRQYARTAGSYVRRYPRRSAAVGAAVLALGWWGLHSSSATPPTAFREGNRWGLLSASGDTLLPATYASIGEFTDGRAIVTQNGVKGFVDAAGQEVVKPAYTALYPYSDGYARARVGQLYTFLDEKGEELGAFYFNAHDFTEGYAAVRDYRGWFYITGPDVPTDPVIFQEAHPFSKGLARVKTRGRFTFITSDFLADTTEGTAPFGRYTLASDFDKQDRARVKQGGRTFYINRKAEEVKE
ncbi:hypothetical protein HMJ29_05565 [Hymenobacter taeanensis]|uniref:WG repeat-containing protein n=1 Tax=Hymenobacter taeanensis TaxID=2735321 RepID=A0A6M6BD67_9BACT|nr:MULTISPECIES: WG repeat-containing protein [Hymenobacter]QJX46431.1 hypothetical protein HMJ29_05565 [Hymenobacter taeanensis]UOQ80293.1 WG repeat-containing protein [Hymenobacter sp. 5414T-23]